MHDHSPPGGYAATCIGIDFPTALREESHRKVGKSLPRAITCVGMEFPTFLGEESPSKVGKSMPMHVAACSRMQRT